MNTSKIKPIFNKKSARVYRAGDYSNIKSPTRIHYSKIVKELSGSFLQKINVLDFGCGTGRYFHVLENTQRLLGIDISKYMINEAKKPNKMDEINIKDIKLIAQDPFIFDYSL